MLYRISVLKKSILRIVLLLSFCFSETLEGAKKLTLAYKSFVLQVCNFIKKDSDTGVFMSLLQNLSEKFF